MVNDDFLLRCARKRLRNIYIEQSHGKCFEITEKLLLELYFPTHGDFADAKRSLTLNSCRVSDTFVHDMFEVRLKFL